MTLAIIITAGMIGLIGTLLIVTDDGVECPRIALGYDCQGKWCDHESDKEV